MYSVLFICTGNLYRSPIAAEIFREQLIRDGRSDQWLVSSAGTWTTSGRRPPRDAVELAHSFGINIAGHMTSLLDAKILEASDLVLVMEEGHKESIQVEFPSARQKVRLLSQVLDGLTYDIPDPAAALGDKREIIQDLVDMMRTGYGNIYKFAEAI